MSLHLVVAKRLTLVAALALILACDGAAADPVKSLLEIRREKVVIQEWDLSCGAAALTTLLHYQYNDPVTEKEVATALINRAEYIENPQLVQIREGFSLLDLKRYVDARGYTGIGLGKMTLGDLELRAPILIPIHTKGYNHFVVFRGRLGNRVLLADPAWGNRTMTIEKFNRAWIDYPQIGQVGFVVESHIENDHALGSLKPKASDFVTFN
ncbi:MAG: C39 family peptidase [Chromatiales bacterium]|nr:C39 family peptidase [Chromatiales bacterium]